MSGLIDTGEPRRGGQLSISWGGAESDHDDSEHVIALNSDDIDQIVTKNEQEWTPDVGSE
jgi:hypothetical protein